MKDTRYTIKSVIPPTYPVVAVFDNGDGLEIYAQVELWAVVEVRHGKSEDFRVEVEPLTKARHGEMGDPWHLDLACTSDNFLGCRDGTETQTRMPA